MLTPHALLVPRSKNIRAIPLLSLRAFVTCKRGESYVRMVYQRDKANEMFFRLELEKGQKQHCNI
jgi:hypothetical protein